MARPLRINNPGGWYHAMNRGIERRCIYADDKDRRHFVGLIGRLGKEFGIQVHAYCLMSNHYHLALHTPRANLSQGMKWLGQSYSGWFNRRHDRVGPLFQGRFKSHPVDPNDWLFQLSLYIHLNPVKTTAYGLGKAANQAEARGAGARPEARDVSQRLQKLRGYRWSSYRAYAGYAETPEWLACVQILDDLGKTLDERRRKYRDWARNELKRGVEETVFERFRESIAVGGADFLKQMKQKAGRPGRETERRSRLSEEVSFEQVLTAVQTARGEPATRWIGRHGDVGKWVVLCIARRRCGSTLAELGRRIGGMDYAAVSVGVKRFERRLRHDRTSQRLMNKAIKLLKVET